MKSTKQIRQAIALGILVFISLFSVKAQTGVPVSSMAHCDTMMQNLLNTYGIQGGTFALTRNGRLVYSRGFGTANQAGTELVQPYHLFRIASVSKPITSVGVMRLIENGDLNLDETVFGPSGILAGNKYFANANITDARIFNITVRHLLEHSAGWNRDIPMTPNPLPPYPWGYGDSDPIGFPLHVTQTLGESNPVARRSMIKFLLQRGLNFTPGTSYTYSNIGYLVLAEIIEERTGIPYEQYMKSLFFDPVGAFDMHIAGNLLADKREREAEYNGPFQSLSIFGTGQIVSTHYGGLNIAAMDAHGGWIATSRDMVRFVTSVDGYSTRPDLLQQSTLMTMTTPSANFANYAKGWQVQSPAGFTGNWWHTGSFDGSSSFIARTNGQFTWALIFNETAGGNYFNAMDAVPWNCMAATTSYPDHDLFDVPETPSSVMVPAERTNNSIALSWTPGNGTGRIVMMRADSPPNRFPIDGTDYTAPVGGPYTDLGNGNIVVYSGTGNSVNISGLQAGTNYNFRVFEYNKSSNTGNNSLYQLGRSLTSQVSTLAPGANGSISGRVTGSTGRGAANAIVTVHDQAGNVVATGRTSSFGYYTILNLPIGINYSITASAKRENFPTVDVLLNGALEGVDIISVVSTVK